MKIAMSLSDNNEGYNDTAQGATVELSETDLKDIQRLSEVCKQNSIYRVSRFENPLDFFDIDWETDERREFEGAVECVTLNVTTTDFFWSGYYKHTSVRWETATVPIGEALLGEDLDYTE